MRLQHRILALPLDVVYKSATDTFDSCSVLVCLLEVTEGMQGSGLYGITCSAKLRHLVVT